MQTEWCGKYNENGIHNAWNKIVLYGHTNKNHNDLISTIHRDSPCMWNDDGATCLSNNPTIVYICVPEKKRQSKPLYRWWHGHWKCSRTNKQSQKHIIDSTMTCWKYDFQLDCVFYCQNEKKTANGRYSERKSRLHLRTANGTEWEKTRRTKRNACKSVDLEPEQLCWLRPNRLWIIFFVWLVCVCVRARAPKLRRVDLNVLSEPRESARENTPGRGSQCMWCTCNASTHHSQHLFVRFCPGINYDDFCTNWMRL